VVQRRQGVSLASEALGEPGIGNTLGREKLERDQPIQGFLPGFVNHAHPAPPKTLDDFQLGKMRRDLVWQ
jgi:hypothetical protein